MRGIRYDDEREIYRDCRFCGGQGCLACPGEADAAYRREFPDGPKPIATFKTDDPKDMEILRSALKDAFEDKGQGIDQFISAITKKEAGDEKTI